tara:strand:- start:47 stop:433 length:387 start_codon:yes stop_codon:yes gene_type:complete
MAHFAKLDESNIVTTVNVVHNSELLVDGTENEQKGINFLKKLYNWDYWKQTSYNTTGGVHKLGGTSFRKNYAGIGYTYDADRDAFIAPQPYPSWTLNDDTCLWDPPVAYPDDGQIYEWNESTTSWDVI